MEADARQKSTNRIIYRMRERELGGQCIERSDQRCLFHQRMTSPPFIFNHFLLANPWFLILPQILLTQHLFLLLLILTFNPPWLSFFFFFLTCCWNIYDWVACSDLGKAFISLCTLSISFVAFSSTALSCFISLSAFPLLPKLALLKSNVFSFPFCCGFNSLWYKHDYY